MSTATRKRFRAFFLVSPEKGYLKYRPNECSATDQIQERGAGIRVPESKNIDRTNADFLGKQGVRGAIRPVAGRRFRRFFENQENPS